MGERKRAGRGLTCQGMRAYQRGLDLGLGSGLDLDLPARGGAPIGKGLCRCSGIARRLIPELGLDVDERL